MKIYIVEDLNCVWIGNFHLFVFWARFNRHDIGQSDKARKDERIGTSNRHNVPLVNGDSFTGKQLEMGGKTKSFASMLMNNGNDQKASKP